MWKTSPLCYIDYTLPIYAVYPSPCFRVYFPYAPIFHLQEANETLNTIRPLMDEVQRIREKILQETA